MKIPITKRRRYGLTLVELLVVIAVILVLIGLLLPTLAKAGRGNRRNPCVSNLKNVGLAFRIFASDHQDRFPMQVSTNEGGSLEFFDDGSPLRHLAVLSNELSTPKMIVCPKDTKRKEATKFSQLQPKDISYFVGLDATETQPGTLLAGDRNLSTNGRPVQPGLANLTTNMVVGWTKDLHNLVGNIAMGDGSVQQFSAPRLAEALRGTGMATNRLAVP